MKIPYNRLHIVGQTLFASRGGNIHSFSLVEGAHISTWKHPDADDIASASQALVQADAEVETPVLAQAEDEPRAEGDEPPSKRQRLEDEKDEVGNIPGSEGVDVFVTKQDCDELDTRDGDVKGGKEEKSKKNERNHQEQQTGPRRISKLPAVPERPIITQFASTTDGSHVAAVSGHDKTIWVFLHDGKGNLTQLSQRMMPKRPSSILITPDSLILCADKFGDVYSLPLVVARITTQSTTVAKPDYKPAANNLTVHSKRNLRALTQQQKHMELTSRAKKEQTAKAESQNFEHTLQLGHVSMLTGLLLAESEGRRYIVTCDRDEHIRVSRNVPHAHVIEGFCLGHKGFVGSMTVPLGRGDILVSGGGDEDLFVWDWKSSSLLSKTNILQVVQEITPAATKVAVWGLYSLLYPGEPGLEPLNCVLAICEDIKAIFSWELTEDNRLTRPGVIQLPGNPLDLAVFATGDSPPTIVAAIDLGEITQARSLHRFTLTMNEGRLAVETEFLVEDKSLEAQEMDVTETEVRSLFYTVEHMRKQTSGHNGEDADEVEVGDVEIADI